jgi:flagellar basal-body rod modification protein FlgD
MVSQMTSFTISEGITSLNDKFDSFATSMTSNQALQATSLIGQNVLLPGNSGYVANAGEGFSGVVVNERTAQNMEITIENEIGEVQRVIKSGTQPAGNIEFNWDGTDQYGNQLPPGNYVVKAQGQVFGEETALPTAINRHVDSVSLAASSNSVILNLDGDVSVELTDVIQIGG